MKRITALILVVFLCLCITACGNGATDAFGSDGIQSSQTASTDTSSQPASTTHSTAATQTTAPATSTESTDNTVSPHTHAFDVKVVNPTCTEAGYTYSVCECGHSVKSDKVAALGHDFGEYVSDNNATCTEDGTKTASCTRCDEKDVITEEGTAKGHNFVESIVGPTTEEQGYTKHTCSNCGYTYKDNYVDKLPEEPEDNTTYPTEREDYPFDDITPENITTDQYEEMTLEEIDEFVEIWDNYFIATNGGEWTPEANHNWIYATVYGSYSCGWANHVCYSEEYHYWLLAHECDTCGSTECPANYVLDPKTLYTQPDGTQCPEYEERNDPSKYCQECGYPKWEQAKPGEIFCTTVTQELPCPDCGETIQPGECHHCVKPGTKSASVNALIPEKKRNTF